MTMIYEFKPGAHVPPGASPTKTVEALRDVEERQGALTQQSLATDVESDPQDHSLREWFTWDTDTGMHKLHVMEAGCLIRCVVVKEIVPQQQEPVRAYFLGREGEDETQEYKETSYIIQDVNLRGQMMARVKAEFDTAEKKRRELFDLADLAGLAAS